MSFTAASLADGFVATTTGNIYLCPSSADQSIVSYVSFYNVNAATQTLNIYLLRSGGIARQIEQVSLAQFADHKITVRIPLSTGDSI